MEAGGGAEMLDEREGQSGTEEEGEVEGGRRRRGGRSGRTRLAVR